MRTTESRQHINVTAPPTAPPHPIVPPTIHRLLPLSPTSLLKLLNPDRPFTELDLNVEEDRIARASGSNVVKVKDEKKRAEFPNRYSDRSRKRAKTSRGGARSAVTRTASASIKREDEDVQIIDLPNVAAAAAGPSAGTIPKTKAKTKNVPVWTHTILCAVGNSVDFENLPASGSPYDGWRKYGPELSRFLAEKSAGGGEKYQVEIANAQLKVVGSNVVVVAALGDPTVQTRVDGDKEKEKNSPFVLQPFLDPDSANDDADAEAEEHDYKTRKYADLLLAACALQDCEHPCVNLATKLFVVVDPQLDRTMMVRVEGEEDLHELDVLFYFKLEVRVDLVFPTVSQAFGGKNAEALEEARRRVLAYVLRPSSNGEGSKGYKTYPGYPGQTNIPFLFSLLGSAPDVKHWKAHETIQHPELRATLRPFQRRSIGWLLDREDRAFNASGKIIDKDDQDDEGELPLFWTKITAPVPGDVTWYYNRLLGVVSVDRPPRDDFVGGILAEEPGLGKTLESIGLILLNPALHIRMPLRNRWDAEAEVLVKEIKTTLIVTPLALAGQWADELQRHAPTLKIFMYEGWTKARVPASADYDDQHDIKPDPDDDFEDGCDESDSEKSRGSKSRKAPNAKAKGKGKAKVSARRKMNGLDTATLDWSAYLNTYDVVITTYNTLQQDLTVARVPPKRPRREVAAYVHQERVRSPLIQCEWHRVVMDEVQMVGGGKTEEMVSLIPRRSSFAVSGTPARASVDDLIHVLRFLRVPVPSTRVWSKLQKAAFSHEFAQLFKKIAIRTVKAKVQNELTIPQQSRFIVPIQLGKVERHIYDQNFEQALLDLGLDERGVAATENWQVDTAVLRQWVKKLRGICTHPQVGQLKLGDKTVRAGAVKSIAEVLEGLKTENWRLLMNDKRAKIVAVVKKARLVQHIKNNPQRYKQALEIMQAAKKEIQDIIVEIKEDLREQSSKKEATKKTRRKSGVSDGKGKGKEGEESQAEDEVDPSQEEEEEEEEEGSARLRDAQVLHHQISFVMGDIYHMLGGLYSALEDQAYADAEEQRKSLLAEAERRATRCMTVLEAQLYIVSEKNEPPTLDDLTIPKCAKGLVHTKDLLRKADGIIELMNQQAELLMEWRSKIAKLLTQKLSAGKDDDQVDGEEYSRTLETQGEAEVYLQAYAALLADRREGMVAERTALAAHDVRERKLRHTKAAMKASVRLNERRKEDWEEEDEPLDLQPEHEVEKATLMALRKTILKQFEGQALKSIVVKLNAIAAKIKSDNDPEKITAVLWTKTLRGIIAEQGKLHDKLESDMAQFRKTFNERIQYFRQLQELSDTVRDVEWDMDVGLDETLAITTGEITILENEINKSRARQRYLAHMVDNQDAVVGEDDDVDENCCILCRCEFTRGFMTHCVHVFCEDCLKAWMEKKEGKACPVCRSMMNVDQLQRITTKENSPPPTRKDVRTGDPLPKSRRVLDYNKIDPVVFEDIRSIETEGSYGSKIQTLMQHLLYLQRNDPGAKSIVFSAWADSLHIIQQALIANGIPCLKIDQKRNKKSAASIFQDDPDILVLLLHGERENAGLNVTCASRVFLVESVVQHGFEIQAIARIDRMGQTRPTEVYCYFAEETIERNILDMSARQGWSLYLKENSTGTLMSLTIDAEKEADGKKKKQVQRGDFIMKVDDMLATLFPHMFEDIDYLLPEDGDVEMETGEWAEGVAGPSRR